MLYIVLKFHLLTHLFYQTIPSQVKIFPNAVFYSSNGDISNIKTVTTKQLLYFFTPYNVKYFIVINI